MCCIMPTPAASHQLPTAPALPASCWARPCRPCQHDASHRRLPDGHQTDAACHHHPSLTSLRCCWGCGWRAVHGGCLCTLCACAPVLNRMTHGSAAGGMASSKGCCSIHWMSWPQQSPGAGLASLHGVGRVVQQRDESHQQARSNKRSQASCCILRPTPLDVQ